jgi:hypothetical protein
LDGKRRAVVAIRDDWLVQDRWWTDSPVDRHYFELVIEPGRVIVVFHDVRAAEWHTHTPANMAGRAQNARPT